jgi:phage terminase large subunit GpA-like protein
MAVCDTCGNDYDKTFTIMRGTESGTFDSFECAAHTMAPTCEHCECRILGHGVETDGQIFCCAHCAHQAGADQDKQLADRS